jgi:glucose/mannose-6-phosphate isomerase
MLDLDSPERFKGLDPKGMLAQMDDFPQQCARGWTIGQGVRVPDSYRTVGCIVVCGLGGSGIGGDLLRTLLLPECRLPVIVHRDYNVPEFVNESSLCIVCSHSGNTEEALSAFHAARERGARVACVTSGGALASLAQEHGTPLYRYQFEAQPRAALGYSLMGQLSIVQAARHVSDKSDDVAEAVRIMLEWQAEISAEVPLQRNAAKQMAQSLYQRIPVIYGAEHLSEVARRWKGQINENSKSSAIWDVLPEANHNSVVGYEYPKQQPSWLHFVLLGSDLYHPRVAPRIRLTRDLLAGTHVPCTIVEARGESRLAQMLAVAHFADYASYYLAMLYGTDPWSIAKIERVKEYMASL